MRDYLTADDICNQIAMNRSLFKGTVLMAEGNTDMRLYSKFTNPRDVKILPAHSKSNVISVVNKMAARRDGKVIGIVDRDLDEMKGRMISPPIFYTDFRDLEMMLINSRALEDVLSEYADQDREHRFERQFGPIRERIINAAYPLGLLMYVSHLRGHNLNFKNLDFRLFIDKKTLAVDGLRMTKAVVMNTYGCELSHKNLLKDLEGQMGIHGDAHKIARGHDCVDILLIGLKDAFGSYNALNLSEGGLGGALRLAFSQDDFRDSELYKETRKWSEARGIRLWSFNRGRSLPS